MSETSTGQVQPFAIKYSPQIPELLQKLNCSLAISTYQAGKVVVFSPKDENVLTQLPRSYVKAMGLAIDGDQMAIATKSEVLYLKNSKDLAKYYPNKEGVYDNMFMPRAAYFTGAIDIHDIDFDSNNDIVGVATSFSCLCKVDKEFSFTPIWTPKFIDRVVAEDRCHLNGMAMLNGVPKYVTAFSTGNTPQSWRETVTTSGVLIDVPSKEIVASDLKMPHSPRFYNGALYCLFSATGELVQIDPSNGSYRVVKQIDGFVRGMAFHEGYAFIGLSKLRKNSSTFAKLAIAEKSNRAGIVIIHLATGAHVGDIIYQQSVDEIYDVQVMPGMMRPNLLNTINDTYNRGLTAPHTTFWARENPNAEKKE